MHHINSQLIDQYQNSGLTQKKFCSQNSISLSSLQYHLRKRKAKAVDSPKKFLQLIATGNSGRQAHNASTIIVIRGIFSSREIADILSTTGQQG